MKNNNTVAIYEEYGPITEVSNFDKVYQKRRQSTGRKNKSTLNRRSDFGGRK